MNKKVFKVYMKFYIGIICFISVAAVFYALITKTEIPLILAALEILSAVLICTIMALISGRSTRIVEQHIPYSELESFRQYLSKQQFAEKNSNEYYWNRAPVFLLKSVEVKIENENDEFAKILLPFTIINWRKI